MLPAEDMKQPWPALGPAFRGTNFAPKTFSANVLGRFNSTTIFKKLLRQDGKTELGGGHSLNETLNRWKLILRVYESVAIYKK